jgi:hypothetical protein
MLLSSRAGVGNSEGERSGSGSSAVWCNGKCAGGDLIEKSTDPLHLPLSYASPRAEAVKVPLSLDTQLA